MTLDYYYAAGTCSLTGMIALDATGADYTPVAVTLAGDRAALRAVSPAGKVPALRIDGRTLTETIAILGWTARRFPAAGILPEEPEAMADAMSQLSWLASTLHIRRRQFARPMSFCADPAVQQALSAAARGPYWQELERFDAWLDDEADSAAAACLAVRAYALLVHDWARQDGLPVASLDHLSGLASAMRADPATAHALDLHAVRQATPLPA